MRKQTAVVCALVLAGAGMAVTLPARATPPRDVEFIVSADFSQDPPSLTWVMTGAIEDAGDIEFLPWIQAETHWAAIPSPQVGTLHQDAILHGANGTMELQLQGVLRLTNEPGVTIIENGSWVIQGGTGAYAGLHGTGGVQIVFNDDPAIPDVGTFTGRVHD